MCAIVLPVCILLISILSRKVKPLDKSSAATGDIQDNHFSPAPPSPTSTVGSVILSHNNPTNAEVPRRIDAEEFAELTAVSIGSAVGSNTSEISDSTSDHANRSITMPAQYNRNRFLRGSFHTLEPVPEAVGDEDDAENESESSHAMKPPIEESQARPSTGRNQVVAGNNTDYETDTESEARMKKTGTTADALAPPPDGSRVVSFSIENSKVLTNSRLQISCSSEEQRLLASSSSSSSGSLRSQMHLEISKLAENISTSLGGNKLSSSGSVFSYAPSRSVAPTRSNTAPSSGSNLEQGDVDTELTEKAVIVIRRVMDKLTGLDFNNNVERNTLVGNDSPSQSNAKGAVALDVPGQVERLIQEATSNENLSLCFFGWCPFW